MPIEQNPFWGTTTDLIASDRSTRAVRRDLRRLQRGVYADPTTTITDMALLRAAVMRAGPGAVVAGTSAAVLHGTQFIDIDGVEMIRNLNGQGRKVDGVRILRTDRLEASDIDIINGLAVTNPVRTAYDIGRRGPQWLALARLDDLARVTDLDPVALWAYIRDHPRARGICQIRELIKHIDPKAESPGESWLRHLIITAGLPRPDSQVEVFAPDGQLIARLDFCYRRQKVDVEYDGIEHHTSPADRASNAERDRRLRELGWDIIRVTGEKIAANPDKVVATIDETLAIRDYRT